MGRLEVPAPGQDTEWGDFMGLSKQLERGLFKPTGFLYDGEKEDVIYNKGVDLKGKRKVQNAY